MRVLYNIFAIFLTLALAQQTQADHAYYGESFYQKLKENQLTDKALKTELFFILTSYHTPRVNSYDDISKSCSGQCYKHSYNSYKNSRKFLFGQLALRQDHKGYFVKDVYCGEIYRNSDFQPGKGVGPGKIPDHSVINTEHSWPQSLFTRLHDKRLQKSDLHILYPVKSRVNSQRSNLAFAEVDIPTSEVCPGAKRGLVQGENQTFFEPPDQHKGNVARAMFYFSVRYQIELDSLQEYYLRTWHKLDPVDTQEFMRNNQVFSFQYNRNPFIDHPELVNLIDDF